MCSKILPLALAAAFFYAPAATAQSGSATIEMDPVYRIGGMRLKQTATVKIYRSKGKRVPAVRIVGRFAKKGWGLFYRKKWLLKKSSNRRTFSVLVPLKGPETKVVLGYQGPSRKTRRGRLIIRYDEYDVVMAGETPKDKGRPVVRRVKRWSFTPSVGGTSISYKQTDESDLSILSLTTKLSASYRLLRSMRLILAFNTFFNALQLSTNNAALTVRFLGVNGRVGYEIPLSKRKGWDLTLYGGLYYVTMLVTPESFGFENLSGPQLYPVIKKTMGNGNFLYGYGKYSPINGLSDVSVSREIAGGLGYGFRMKNGRYIVLGADYANLKFTVNTIAVDTTSISGSIGYAF